MYFVTIYFLLLPGWVPVKKNKINARKIDATEFLYFFRIYWMAKFACFFAMIFALIINAGQIYSSWKTKTKKVVLFFDHISSLSTIG